MRSLTWHETLIWLILPDQTDTSWWDWYFLIRLTLPDLTDTSWSVWYFLLSEWTTKLSLSCIMHMCMLNIVGPVLVPNTYYTVITLWGTVTIFTILSHAALTIFTLCSLSLADLCTPGPAWTALRDHHDGHSWRLRKLLGHLPKLRP